MRKAEKELEDRQNAPLAELQQWLQLTYELESRHYDAKKEAVERHLIEAKEMVKIIRTALSDFSVDVMRKLLSWHNQSFFNLIILTYYALL